MHLTINSVRILLFAVITCCTYATGAVKNQAHDLGLIAFRDGTTISIRDINGLEVQKLGDTRSGTYMCPVWSRRERSILVVGGTEQIDVHRIKFQPLQEEVIAHGEDFEPDLIGAIVSLSPDETKIAFVGQISSKLYLVDIKNESTEIIDKIEFVNVDWSPNSDTLVVFGKDKSNQVGIFLIDHNRQLTRIVPLPEADFVESYSVEQFFTRSLVFPHWSPEGNQIAFASSVSGNLEIYLVNSDGTNLHPLTSDDGADFAPTWSPDGRYIAYVSHKVNGTKGIYIRGTEGAGEREIATFRDGGCPSWGKLVY